MRTAFTLAPLYLSRLGLDDKPHLTVKPSIEALSTIVEAHLSTIPFENLAQHGARGGPASLNVEDNVDKILRRRRGGFCFELNGLFAELLIELGYGVTRVPAFVYIGSEPDEYRPEPTHLILIATIPMTQDVVDPGRDGTKEKDDGPVNNVYFIDVGFGEPAIHPLPYEFDTEYQTPDGMLSRLVRNEQDVVLEWFRHEKAMWTPRIKFNAKAATIPPHESPKLEDFAPNLLLVQQESSIFAQKLVVCRLTREEKITIAGSRLKRTGPPRFGAMSDETVTITDLETVDRVREVMKDMFGIPLEETEGLDLVKSLAAPAGLWT